VINAYVGRFGEPSAFAESGIFEEADASLIAAKDDGDNQMKSGRDCMPEGVREQLLADALAPVLTGEVVADFCRVTECLPSLSIPRERDVADEDAIRFRSENQVALIVFVETVENPFSSRIQP